MRPGVSIEATGVHRRFGSHVVLNDLHLSAEPGEFVAIVGSSGGGKSTLLRLFAGLDQPDQGSIQIGGEQLTGRCPSARVMFQDGRLLPWLRVGDNVGIGLSNPDRGHIREMLSHVGLANRIAASHPRWTSGHRARALSSESVCGR
jgi:sulfonate transport system ATP-binding protein